MTIGPYKEEDLRQVAKQMLAIPDSSNVWCFFGEMGAGKTTLIKSICEELGVTEGTSSPTFNLVNEYETESSRVIYHFDFYRLVNETEALDIGVDEYLYSGNYCFIEWPERIPHLLPKTYLKINIIFVDEVTRSIRLN